MLAARLHAPGEDLRLEDVPIPEPEGTEVRIRVAACGVCRTDLHVVDGTQARVELPRTLGHEVSGFVDKLGADAGAPLKRVRLSVGDPVVVAGGWGCGECAQCRDGAEQRCDQSLAPGFQRDGGYAEPMLVPHPRHLVGLGRIDPVRAAPLADAGITPYRAVRRVRPWLEGGARVLVIGCGALGQFALQYLRLGRGGRDLHVVVREIDPAKLEIAARLGADVGLLDGDAEMTREALGGSAAVVLDMVGTDETLADAAAAVAPNGVVLLIGEAGGRLSMGMDGAALESWFTSVAWGSRDDLREVVRLAGRRRLKWDAETLPLARANEAHARLRAGGVSGRLVLVPGS
jgi:propanol-preferring alcohol dehydrogenase